MNRNNTKLPEILFFGNDWFAENRTSSHQIARGLASRGYRVYYIECPGLRAPKGSGRDARKIWAKIARFAAGARPAGDNIRVRTLLQVPLHRFGLVRRLNRNLILATIRWLMWREGIQRPISWFMIPHLASVVGQVGECLAIYYCIDDYAALPDVDPEAVQAMDEEATRRADLVFVASDTLLASKQRLNPSVYVSPHGVDFAHFSRAQDGFLEIPADVADLPGPVVGFFGLIERWIDLELVDYLAENRPRWTFTLIGRVAVPDDQCPRRSNIHYLGKRSYDELPAYAKRFDAAIIPYRLTRQVLHANPIKLREYVATGRPVVSVSTPEIDKYSDVVEIARSREEFLAKLDEILYRPPAAEEVRCRMERIAHESWEARLDEVISVINVRLAAPAGDPGARSALSNNPEDSIGAEL